MEIECFIIIFFFNNTISFVGGSEDGRKSKSARSLENRDAGGDDDENGGLDQRDRLEDDDEETTKVPPGFLSPSVREYLELGRSIPGKSCYKRIIPQTGTRILGGEEKTDHPTFRSAVGSGSGGAAS